MKPDPGVSAGLLAGRAGSWSLAAGPRDPRVCFRSFGADGFLTLLGMGARVSHRLRWPANGQGQGPSGPRVGSDLLLVVCSVRDHSFLASGTCPLVGGAGSWPSGGQGHV